MSALYDNGKLGLANGDIDWVGGDILAMPVGASWSFSAGHQFVSNLTGELGGGSARVPVTGRAITLVGGEVRYVCDNPEFIAANFGDIHAVVYFQDAGSDAARRVVGFTDGPSYPVSTNGGDIIISLPGYAGTLT